MATLVDGVTGSNGQDSDGAAADRASRPTRVLVVDDHPLMRTGVCSVIEAAPGMEVCAEAANGLEALERFATHRPDVTVMDLQMPEMDGLAAVGAIRQQWRDARIVVLTTFNGDARAVRALKAGAVGYLLKSLVRTELLDAIRTVHAGGRYIPREVASALALHLTDDEVSDRELDVLQRVAAGRSNKRVAHELGLSEETVKSHMRHILLKLGANDRTHAVTIALRRGLIALRPEP